MIPETPRHWILIGKLGSVHGLRGELKLFTLTDIPGRWEELAEIWWLGLEKKQQLLHILSVRAAACGYLIRFKGVEDRDSAGRLACGDLAVPEEKRGQAPAGTYFIDDVIGLDVEDEGGQAVGKVTDVYQTGANDIYAVSCAEGEILLPALKTVILGIDLKRRRMRVRRPLDYRV